CKDVSATRLRSCLHRELEEVWAGLTVYREGTRGGGGVPTEGGSPGPNSSPSLPDRLPKPSLRAENGSVVPRGRNVTLRCRGSWEAEEWRLEKRGGSGWSETKTVRQAGNEGEFSFPSVTSHDAGTYRCLYRHSSSWWSERSDPLELVVTDAAAQDYTVGNLVRLTLAGLVLVLLGVLLAEHWKSSREQPIPGVLG
uniref:Ig-like domain-containing protein n=1 Tax=Monodelphis domestica TaxID=13616 RepID=A0A5F8HAY9_MONDO